MDCLHLPRSDQGTLRNFYEKLLNLGKGSNCEVLVDKHDLGDILIKLGFDSPILASSDIVLKYSDPVELTKR